MNGEPAYSCCELHRVGIDLAVLRVSLAPVRFGDMPMSLVLYYHDKLVCPTQANSRYMRTSS